MNLILLIAGAFAVVNGPNGTVKAPLFSGEYDALPIASIDRTVVTLGDLSGAIAASHTAHGIVNEDKAVAGGKKDYTPVLNRLIGVKLIVLEAHDIGLDEEADVKEQMARMQDSGMREGLKARITKDVKFDPVEVERIYKESVREWKVRSLLFPNEAAAKDAKNRNWDKGQPQLVSDSRRALAMVISALQPLKPGEVTAPLRVEKGFAVLRVEAISYPDDAQKRREAEDVSLKRQQAAVLGKYYEGLVARSATVNKRLLAKIDFEAKKPGFDALLKDKRVVAKVKDGKDVTVGDVAAGIKAQFFHGIQQAIASHKVNAEKLPMFNSILYAEVFGGEAKRQHIDETPEYKKAIADEHDALVFGKFVEKVVAPEVKITEGEAKAFYEQHKGDYTYPAFYTLSSIAFENPKAAQDAFDKLKAGTDFKWLKSNAAGQLAEDRREIDFESSTVSGRGVPGDLGKLLNGAKAGDVRIYAAKEGGSYLIQVKAVTPPSPQPYPEARADIAPKLQRIKVNKGIEEWIGKLRKARDVKVFISQLGS